MSEAEWLRTFGDNLQYVMDDYGITQHQLARATGLSQGTISKYVNKLQMPTVRALLAISYALNESLDNLMDFGDVIDE